MKFLLLIYDQVGDKKKKIKDEKTRFFFFFRQQYNDKNIQDKKWFLFLVNIENIITFFLSLIEMIHIFISSTRKWPVDKIMRTR